MSRPADSATVSAGGGVALGTVIRVRALMPSLAPAERRVARHVIDAPEEVSGSTITELAQGCGTSETTVIRFCRAIGFTGYPELRLTLANEVGRAQGIGGGRIVGADIGRDDTLKEIVQKISYADARAVEETAHQLDIQVLEDVVTAIVDARRVDIYGVSAGAFVAMDFQQKLHRIGRVSYAWSDAHMMLTSAAVLEPGDVALGISHSGATVDTIDALSVAGRRGAVTVALTSFPRSPIAEVVDLVLTTAIGETTFRSGATASRLAQLTVIDCVFVGVAQRTYAPTKQHLEATLDAVRGRGMHPERRRR
jgi:DNA-binding MurR/RpiR family transcriptional regulator